MSLKKDSFIRHNICIEEIAKGLSSIVTRISDDVQQISPWE